MAAHGLTENHERSLLASVHYAAQLIRQCEGIRAASDRPSEELPADSGFRARCQFYLTPLDVHDRGDAGLLRGPRERHVPNETARDILRFTPR
jgi:hypothetical protein